MPLVYQQNINQHTKLGVWHIGEEEAFFLERVPLHNAITHPHKRLQHLAGRFLLTELYDAFPLSLIQIADTRKPFLADDAYHFSISHCGDYAAAIVSSEHRVGVDIEIVSEKVNRIRHKFLVEEEMRMIGKLGQSPQQEIHTHLVTLAWSIKESMYKWYGKGEVGFREHLRINAISINMDEFAARCTFQKSVPVEVEVHGLMFNGNILTWLVT